MNTSILASVLQPTSTRMLASAAQSHAWDRRQGTLPRAKIQPTASKLLFAAPPTLIPPLRPHQRALEACSFAASAPLETTHHPAVVFLDFANLSNPSLGWEARALAKYSSPPSIPNFLAFSPTSDNLLLHLITQLLLQNNCIKLYIFLLLI
jgi:hypothetical protein